MAVTVLWTPTKPANSDDPRLGAGRMRDIQQGIYERLRNGGMNYPASDEAGSPDTTAGRLVIGFTDGDGAIGTANEFNIYDTDKTTIIFKLNKTAKTCTLPQSGWEFQGENITTGLDPGHTHSKSLVLGLGTVTATGRVHGVLWRNMSGNSVTINNAQLFSFTAPSGGTVVIDIHKLTNAEITNTANNIATFAGTSMIGTGIKPSVADGKTIGAEVDPNDASTPWDSTTLAAGDGIVVEVDTYTSPATDLVLVLDVQG